MDEKTCCICGSKKAKYLIKGTNTFYCKECAKENFGDLDCLQTIKEAEKQAQKLKEVVEKNEKI